MALIDAIERLAEASKIGRHDMQKIREDLENYEAQDGSDLDLDNIKKQIAELNSDMQEVKDELADIDA